MAADPTPGPARPYRLWLDGPISAHADFLGALEKGQRLASESDQVARLFEVGGPFLDEPLWVLHPDGSIAETTRGEWLGLSFPPDRCSIMAPDLCGGRPVAVFDNGVRCDEHVPDVDVVLPTAILDPDAYFRSALRRHPSGFLRVVAAAGFVEIQFPDGLLVDLYACPRSSLQRSHYDESGVCLCSPDEK